MSRRTALIVIFAAACGDNIVPVDGKFRAAVEGPGVPAGAMVSIDVLWRDDGAVNLTFDDPDGVIPGPRALPAVVLQEGGAVRMRGPVARWTGAKPDQLELDGFIASDALELDLSDTPSDGGGSASVHLRGDARPLGDPDALDGAYTASTVDFPRWCPGNPGGSAPGRNVRLDVMPVAGGVRMEIEGIYAFTVPVTDGKVGWTGPVRIVGNGSTFTASVSGTVSAAGVDIAFDEPGGAIGPDCADRRVLTGAKRLPDAKALDGDYRATFDWTDACDATTGHFVDQVSILTQAGGVYDFFDPMGWVQFDLKSGRSFSGDFVDFFGSGADIHYEGVADPPKLTYTATYTYPFDPPCTLTLRADAYKRFLLP